MQRAEDRLLLERVDLDHDPVDLVVELEAAGLPVAAGLRDFLDRVEPLRERVRAKAVLPQPLQRLPLRLEVEAVRDPDPVDPYRQRARRGDRGVLLAERARGGVARVRGELLPALGDPLVQL